MHISQLYSCSKVDLPCELYYIAELGKYSYKNYNTSLDISGVVINNELKNQIFYDYFQLAISKGWIENSSLVDKYNTNKLTKVSNIKFTTEVRPLIETSTDIEEPREITVVLNKFEDMVLLDFNSSINNINYNTINFNNDFAEQRLLSVIAMLHIEKFYKKNFSQFIINFNSNILLSVYSMSYVLMLLDETTILTNWFQYVFDKTVTDNQKVQQNYFAWYKKGIDQKKIKWGNLSEKKDKLKELDIQVGDFVFLYKRKQEQAKNLIKSIEYSRLARIVSINKQDLIELELINTVTPKAHGKKLYDSYSDRVKELYNGNLPYENFNTTTFSISLIDLGVEYLLHTEEYFILSLDKTNDLLEYYVTETKKIPLTQNNLVYWVLKEYRYNFDETRFKLKYFGSEKPDYERGILIWNFPF